MQDWDLRPARDLDLPPGERLRSLRRESGLLETLFHVAWWTFIRAYLGAFHRLEVRGRENLPRGFPFVMVSNHSSHLDALVLGAVLPWKLRSEVFPLAAGDTFFDALPTAAFAALALNALPIWRNRSGSRDVRILRQRLLESPCGYILFPEGTRTRTGMMGAFRPGLGMLVAGTEVPVIPCRLQGAFEALPPGRWLPRPRRVILTVGAPLRFAGSADDRAGWEAVAAAAEKAVRELAAI